MLISGGMSYLVPELLAQFTEFGIEESQIDNLLILHAHFDHVGVVPFLKRRNPSLKVYASARGWEVLEMPKAIATINDFSRKVAERMGKMDVYEQYEVEWRDDVDGEPLSEGDRIDLGDLEIEIYEIPGHSSCSIAAYAVQFRSLFPSDGGGIPYKDTILASGNSNYTLYQSSLEKLADLDVDYLCADHYGYVSGDEARDYMHRSIDLAQKHRAFIEEVYQRSGDMDTAVGEIVDIFFKRNPNYIIAPEIYVGIYRQIVRHIAGALE
jgi:glyoxylase-like metal-dependent hydrolase (beta-lactamase superfamily II)